MSIIYQKKNVAIYKFSFIIIICCVWKYESADPIHEIPDMNNNVLIPYLFFWSVSIPIVRPVELKVTAWWRPTY